MYNTGSVLGASTVAAGTILAVTGADANAYMIVGGMILFAVLATFIVSKLYLKGK